MTQNLWDAVIIGAGPSGLSAALMLGRARRSVLMLDAGAPRNRFAAHMHGVLGHDGRSPAELLELGRAEVRGYGVEIDGGTVERVSSSDNGVSLTLADGSELAARALVVATGVSDDLPPIPGLAERWGTTVLHCPYCHGWEVRDQRIAVIATSPLSVHQIELVRQWSDDVVAFTALAGPIDVETERRMRARDIQLIESPVVEVQADGERITGIRTADGRTTPVDAVFTGGALRPHDRMLDGLSLERSENPMGSFISVDATGRTSHERVWMVGNVVNPGANIPIVMAAGTQAGAMINMFLVTEDARAAVDALDSQELASHFRTT